MRNIALLHCTWQGIAAVHTAAVALLRLSRVQGAPYRAMLLFLCVCNAAALTSAMADPTIDIPTSTKLGESQVGPLDSLTACALI